MATCGTCGEQLGAADNFCGACGAGRDAESGRLFEVPVDDEPTSTDIDESPDSADAATTVIATTSDVELVTCPDCRSLNAAQRARCAQCGAPLRESNTDEQAWGDLREAEPTPAPSQEPAARAATRRRGLPTWAWVIIAGIVVGVGIGVATALGLGPLASTAGPGVDFRASAYPREPAALAPSLVGGSEVREPADGRTFVAPNLLDGNLATTWQPASATGADVTFRFESPVWISAIVVANGDQLDDEAFDATGRVRLATIAMGRGQTIDATLIDGTGRQVVRFPTPALTTEVQVVVEEITGGDDVAMSDIEIIGNEASPRDADAYQENE